MAAESAQEQLLASKAQLEASVTQLKEAQQAAAEERNKEAARVRELEQQASAAEAKAEAKAESLAASEASVASLQKQLDELKRALDIQRWRRSCTAAEGASCGRDASGQRRRLLRWSRRRRDAGREAEEEDGQV